MGYSELGWVEKSIDVVSQVLILEALNSIPFNPKSSTIDLIADGVKIPPYINEDKNKEEGCLFFHVSS